MEVNYRLYNEEKPEYPVFKILKEYGLIVYFTSNKTGIVINTGDSKWKFGETADCFDEKRFEIFTGEITIKIK